MSRYIPNTDGEAQRMLEALGLESMEALFADIPRNVRPEHEIQLPEGLSEPEVIRHMKQLAGQNAHTGTLACFLGAGAYDRFIPAALKHLVMRQEFYTAYTPYQPEISQGTLQAVFEYQSMICRLTGLYASNASLYDGASALAEAARMAVSATGRHRILILTGVNPQYREVLETYCRFSGVTLDEVQCLTDSPVQADVYAAVVGQNPDFYGQVEDPAHWSDAAHAAGALMIEVCDPVSLAVLKSPGEAGVDIAVGEGQSMGNSLSFGGPYLGFLATTREHMRRIPGRVVGETLDRQGRRGYVLTLQTREQHIRREKATSNICSNQALNALTATIWLTLLGREGLQEVALQSLQKAHYLRDRLLETGKFRPWSDKPFFCEFALRTEENPDQLNLRLRQEGLLGGLNLGSCGEGAWGYLIAVTEQRTREEIDRFVRIAGR